MIETAHKAKVVAERELEFEAESSDLAIAVCGFVFVCGLFVDGWAHFHGRVDESFFTPYHALLYGSFGLTALVILRAAFANGSRAEGLMGLVPRGYGQAIVGIVVFAVGGLADLAWHEVFGIEQGVEALISPSHLVLAVGGALIVLTPLRLAWFRPKTTLTTTDSLPIILSTTAFLSQLTFFTTYMHPQNNITALANYRRWSGLSVNNSQELGMAIIIVQTVIMMGLVMLVMQRWRWSLPFGALTTIFTTHSILMSALSDEYDLVLAYVAAGLAADLLVRLLRPGDSLHGVRLIGFLTPVALYSAYFGLLMMRDSRFDWSVPMWTGAVVIAGIVGYLLSILIVPPVVE